MNRGREEPHPQAPHRRCPPLPVLSGRTCPAVPGLLPEEKFGEDVRLLQGGSLHGARSCGVVRCGVVRCSAVRRGPAAATNRCRLTRPLRSCGSPTLSAGPALMSPLASCPCPSPRLCFAQVQKRGGLGPRPARCLRRRLPAAPGTAHRARPAPPPRPSAPSPPRPPSSPGSPPACG